ncbi:2'-5' RNA ligase family protein [Candidatus Parcubacteria bacterium]|nr:2'-5' RNA ligase family protein [Candidatus Parcubacteria bacterium]
MQPRYFIGIALPDELSSRISKIQNDLFQPGKVMQPLVPHITLLNPNMLEKLPPKDFIPQVRKVTNNILPVEIRLSEISMFKKRVIYIKAEGKAAVYLYDELVKLLPDSVRTKFTPNRKFEPHITLAQAKPKQNLDPKLTEQIKTRLSPLLPVHFEAQNLSRFIWQGPRIYQVTEV